jgi:hypothetical protein
MRAPPSRGEPSSPRTEDAAPGRQLAAGLLALWLVSVCHSALPRRDSMHSALPLHAGGWTRRCSAVNWAARGTAAPSPAGRPAGTWLARGLSHHLMHHALATSCSGYIMPPDCFLPLLGLPVAVAASCFSPPPMVRCLCWSGCEYVHQYMRVARQWYDQPLGIAKFCTRFTNTGANRIWAWISVSSHTTALAFSAVFSFKVWWLT